MALNMEGVKGQKIWAAFRNSKKQENEFSLSAFRRNMKSQ